MRSSHLLSSVLGLCRQVVIGIMGLRDPAEEYGHHTWGAEQHVRLQVVKRELSCTPVVQRTECNNPRTQSNRSSESRGRAPAAVILGEAPSPLQSSVPDTGLCCSLPVKPHASASRNVLQDIKKNKPVSSNGNSRSLVNLVTWQMVKDDLERSCRLRVHQIQLRITATLHSLPLERGGYGAAPP